MRHGHIDGHLGHVKPVAFIGHLGNDTGAGHRDRIESWGGVD